MGIEPLSGGTAQADAVPLSYQHTFGTGRRVERMLSLLLYLSRIGLGRSCVLPWGTDPTLLDFVVYTR